MQASIATRPRVNPVIAPQYLSSKYLTILETRHGAGFVDFVRGRAIAVHDEGGVHVAELAVILDAWRNRDRRLPPPKTRGPGIPVAAPLEKWPRWALWVYRRRHPGEQGVGDTVARILDKRGGAAFKRWYKAIMGKDCGCGDRHVRLNQSYPYSVSTPNQPHV